MASGEEQSSATVISSFSAPTLLMPALQGNGQSFATTGDAARTVFHRQRKATQAAIPPRRSQPKLPSSYRISRLFRCLDFLVCHGLALMD
jgi:hypothetical protein